ncbi:AAA family ATPase [Spirillospora sp. CA-253888]
MSSREPWHAKVETIGILLGLAGSVTGFVVFVSDLPRLLLVIMGLGVGGTGLAITFLISSEAPKRFYFRLFPRAGYLDRLRERLRYLPANGLLTKSPQLSEMRDLYIDLALRPVGQEGTGFRTSLRSALVDDGIVVVLGEPGRGKTTLLRHTALAQAERTRAARPHRLPVLIDLSDHAAALVSGEAPSLGQMALPPAQDGVTPKWLDRQIAKGGCLILLDGFDDVTSPEERARLVGWLRRQVDRHPGNAWAVASRPHAHAETPVPGARLLEVCELGSGQIRRFLTRWFEQHERRADVDLSDEKRRARAARRADELFHRIGENGLTELAVHPLLLTLIANVHQFRQEIPGGIADLYQEATDALLYQITKVKGLSDPTGLREPQKGRVVSELAIWMMERELREVAREEAAEIIAVAVRRLGAQRKVTPEEFLDAVRDDGVLAERTPGLLTFAHLPFQEYLAAAWIRERGTVRLLTRNIERPWWRETILLWAADADATPVIEACLDARTPWSLDLARSCVKIAREVSPEVRGALERELDRQAAFPGGPLQSTVLIDYLVQEHADEGRRIIAKARAVNRRIDAEDVRIALAQARFGGDGEADAAAYLSAALLAEEMGRIQEARRHQARGLLSLMSVMSRRSTEAAFDLLRAAVALSESAARPEQARLLEEAIGRLHLLAPGKTAADVPERRFGTDSFAAEVLWMVTALCRVGGHRVLADLLPMIAQHEAVNEVFLRSVREGGERAADVAAFLEVNVAGPVLVAAWNAAVEEWRRDRRRLAYELGPLKDLEPAEEALVEARTLLEREREGTAPASLTRNLRDLARACHALCAYLTERHFEERDDALRTAARIAGAVRADIRDAPTAAAVELAEPAALRIEEIVGKARRELAASSPPRPRVDLAVVPSSRVGDTVTVQITVANEEGAAPLESVRLEVRPDPAAAVPQAPAVALPGTIRGGASHIMLVRLDLTNHATTSFELPVTLYHRRRYSDEDTAHEALLPIRVARPEDFVPVPNPFLAWADGRPVDDPAMFFGRDELVERVRSVFREASEPGAGMVIYGQKRTGKSSIRVQLERCLCEEDGFPVVDVGNISTLEPDPGTSMQRLLGSLLWRILEGAHKAAPDGPRLLPEGFDRKALIDSPDPVHDCAGLFEEHRRAAPGRRPFVVLIDEFQLMDEWVQRELVSATFMQTFKAIVERRLFHLVLIGQANLHRLIRSDPNAFGVFGTERVTFLKRPDAERLVQEPIAAPGGRYRGRAVAEIIRLSGGNPHYIQMLCSDLVEHMNRDRTELVTEADVALVAEDLLGRMEYKHFDNLEAPAHLEDPYGPAERRRVLTAIAVDSRDGPATAHGVEESLLEDLLSREAVQREGGGYRLTVGLYEEWLLRYFGTRRNEEPV